MIASDVSEKQAIAERKRLAANAVASLINRRIIPRASEVPCQACGDVDHIHHYHHHKGYDEENKTNVIPLCSSCHRTAHGKDDRKNSGIRKDTLAEIKRNARCMGMSVGAYFEALVRPGLDRDRACVEEMVAIMQKARKRSLGSDMND